MTRMTDLLHNSKSVVAVTPQVVEVAGEVTGEIIDTQGFYSLMLETILGAVATSKVKITSIKESDKANMEDATDVADAQIFGLAKNVDIDTVKTIGKTQILPSKRYVQVKLTTTTENAIAGAVAVLIGADVDGNINAQGWKQSVE